MNNSIVIDIIVIKITNRNELARRGLNTGRQVGYLAQQNTVWGTRVFELFLFYLDRCVV